MPEYDYIIIGAGAAGLMLADGIGKDAFFKKKQVLVLDKDTKEKNDRTWCFWEKGEGEFDAIVYRSWENIYFAGSQYKERIPIAPYRYKMVRGIDFYSHYLQRISDYPNIEFWQAEVIAIHETAQDVEVHTSEGRISCKLVFDSSFDPIILKEQQQYPLLQQHFVGWFVKTKQDIFDEDMATFMDFSIPQKGNTRFMYVLPFAPNKALIEYTLFSENLLPHKEYEEAITAYLNDVLHCSDYEILDKEQGMIPMTCYNFKNHNTSRIIRIGTAGGWAKASTGYTFKNSQKMNRLLLEHLKKNKPLNSFGKKNRYWFYDLLLLDILHRDNSKGSLIFESIFKNRSAQLLFKFLDEETSFLEDLKTMTGSPTLLFLDALRRRIF